MIRATARQALSITLHHPSLWLLALLAGETGAATIVLPLQAPSGLPLPTLTGPAILTLLVAAAAFWLFSALPAASLILDVAALGQSQGAGARWALAASRFWPLLALRGAYLAVLLALFVLVTLHPTSWPLLAACGLAALPAGLLLNLASRAIVLDARGPWAALRTVLAQPWPLARTWLLGQFLAWLALVGLLLVVLFIEIVGIVVFLVFRSALDPYLDLAIPALGVAIALPAAAYIAFAGSFVSGYWTLAYLRLRA